MRYLSGLLLLLLPSSAAFAVQVSDAGNGNIYVDGTQQADHIVVRQIGSDLAVYEVVSGNYQQLATFDINNVNAVFVEGYGGDDIIVHADSDVIFFASGGTGNDRLYGANLDYGIEFLDGGPGQDYLDGGLGYEDLRGGPGPDFLTLAAWDGSDVAGGTMNGGGGGDFMVGSPFNDIIVAADGEFDFIDCNGGDDFASPYSSHDPIDLVVNCDAIAILSANRTTKASASYDSITGGFPQVPIQETDSDDDDTSALGSWNSLVQADVLAGYNGSTIPAPISSGTGHASDIQNTSGAVSFDLFSDSFWAYGFPAGLNAFGGGRSESTYEVKFEATADATLSIDGFMSYNLTPGNPQSASVSFRVIQHGTTDTVIAQRSAGPWSPQQGNRLVENVDGTTVNIQAGEVYSLRVTGSTIPVSNGANSEATASLTWSVD